MMCNSRRFNTVLIAVIIGAGALTILTYIHTFNKSERTIWKNFERINLKTMFQFKQSPTNLPIIPTKMGQLDKCPDRPKSSARPVNVTTDADSLNVTDNRSGNITPGGRYKPPACISRHRVAVIVPFRDRETHLKLFLNHMHPFLQRQQLDYAIFVVESIPGIGFNRGLLMNVGFIEASKLYEYDCFIFHDVDMLPENDGINYSCDQSPAHFSNAVDIWKYGIPYPSYFGGVCALSKKHFEAINGFSNIYFGWGGEDDDFRDRITYSHLNISRFSSRFGRYKTLKHKGSKANPDRFLLLKTREKRYRADGLNSLKYHMMQQEFKPLYTWILVSVNQTETLESEPIHKQAFRNKGTHKSTGIVRKSKS